jgi:hypothetical protein
MCPLAQGDKKMRKTVLEQALDHLLNKEEGKASALLHDYYVGIGRQVYEDIMADDINFEDEELNAITTAVDEVESDLTEEGDEEVAPEILFDIPVNIPDALDDNDAYISTLLYSNFGLLCKDITPELIEVKRNQLILKRWLKQTNS